MQNFTLITNIYKDQELAITKEIVRYIEQRGGKAGYLVSSASRGCEDYSVSDIPKECECILVLGGDGTLIRAATAVEGRKLPLIGVNLGTLGYLCELEKTTVFAAIDRLMADDYVIEERMMICGHRAGKTGERIALNDIVIRPSASINMLSLHVYVNGEYLTTYHADGIIVATPTGSTGYSMSAGGPIVDPRARMLLLTPINAHNLNSKSIVLGADDRIEIEMGVRRYERDERACVTFDGDPVMELGVGDRVEVCRATNISRICKLSNKSFLELLRKKMETFT